MSGAWSWYSHLSDAFKRRVGRYLINRYLGPFLEEGILLDQLSVSSGCPITLKDVALNTDNINKMLEESEVPVEFVDGLHSFCHDLINATIHRYLFFHLRYLNHFSKNKEELE